MFKNFGSSLYLRRGMQKRAFYGKKAVGYLEDAGVLGKTAGKLVSYWDEDPGATVDENGKVTVSKELADKYRKGRVGWGALDTGLGALNLGLAIKGGGMGGSKKLRAANALAGLAGLGSGAHNLASSRMTDEEIGDFLTGARKRRKGLKRFFTGKDEK